ncbi:ATP-binding cassette domain-containing protein [Bacteroides thetaiotaomicron]|nr:ATP-binding cassette domain-containing protein [Bacteroides thetaiotaomicron]UVV58945.1 ATP-binding cassette domain-containing protein [Bacteroides thetaiotaomicron]
MFGRNGTGKSVLMQIIFGTMKADRKFIRLDECKVLSAPYQHARTIAFLPQQGYLPKHEKINKLVDCYLDANVVPYFYEDDEVAQSCMERRVSQLSGGERRYLEAKLLLLGNAKFVLLDEPFDYLSFHLVDKLIGLIKKHSEEKGIVIADHNYEKVLEVVNRLVLIREGVLMELTDKRGLVEQGYLLDESYL